MSIVSRFLRYPWFAIFLAFPRLSHSTSTLLCGCVLVFNSFSFLSLIFCLLHSPGYLQNTSTITKMVKGDLLRLIGGDLLLFAKTNETSSPGGGGKGNKGCFPRISQGSGSLVEFGI